MAIIENRLQELGIQLPDAILPSPMSDYVALKQSGNLLFISGVGPIKNGMPSMTGKLVKDMRHEDGYEATRLAALNAISIIKKYVGDLDKVEQIIKVTCYVASEEDFYDQYMILNGASHLFNEIFGEKGSHAATVVGVNVLPFNLPVMLDAIVRIKG